jgi:ABC-type nitrate/sulfonate/bicarbonate transport system substrate-binding protein
MVVPSKNLPRFDYCVVRILNPRPASREGKGDPVAMAHALETGRIDAAVLDPALSRGLANKGFSLLLDLFQVNVLFPGLGLGATQVHLDQHSPTIESVVTALAESLAFIQLPSNKPIVLKSMMKNLRMTDPAVRKTAIWSRCSL